MASGKAFTDPVSNMEDGSDLRGDLSNSQTVIFTLALEPIALPNFDPGHLTPNSISKQ